MLIVSLILSVAAGACIYLMLLNRYLLLIEDGGNKKLILRASLVAIGLGAILFGWLAAGTPWLLLPIGVLAAVVAGEVRRSIIRRRHAGEPPIEAANAGVSWRTPITTTDLAVYRYALDRAGLARPRSSDSAPQRSARERRPLGRVLPCRAAERC